jgi:pyruvate dehydrogenase (quinone)
MFHVSNGRIPMSAPTLAEQLIDVLRQTGAERVYGVVGDSLEQPTDLRGGLAEALAHPCPALSDLVTDPYTLSIPPHITAHQVKGFALAGGKTVLDGGVGEMVELARANVRNIARPTIACR